MCKSCGGEEPGREGKTERTKRTKTELLLKGSYWVREFPDQEIVRDKYRLIENLFVNKVKFCAFNMDLFFLKKVLIFKLKILLKHGNPDLEAGI